MRFEPYAAALAEYRDDLKRRVIRKRRVAEQDEVLDPDFAPLDAAIARLRSAAVELDGATIRLESLDAVEGERLAKVNQALSQIERRLLHADGLPGRAWFRHLVYAPGLTTGYASWPLPGLRQAIEQDDPELFEKETPRLVAVLEATTEAIGEAKQAIDALGEP
jgi:N-acetylated-alpha-linked acidic dipeptidase